WAQLLNVERVGRHDNFFDLGGHSLLAVQVISRIKQMLEVELPLANVFQYSTIEALAEAVILAQLSQFDQAMIDALSDEIDQISDEELLRSVNETDPSPLTESLVSEADSKSGTTSSRDVAYD
ncbi:phosphopantetheine-binding protein, partial [Burkholderia ubonensis]|uniref:phosphopantetheine-binding protein n=1 Tax=Burkholderia ubonensis TaxID=101571 RepID=UPI000A5F82C6